MKKLYKPWWWVGFLMIGLIPFIFKGKNANSLYSQIEKKQIQKRLPSSEESIVQEKAECFNDRFTVANLKQQIKTYERLVWAKTNVSGKWKHIELKNLPFAQALLLTKYGNFIGDKRPGFETDFSDCSDVPCIFNKVYKTPNGVEGYAVYFWFLKTGALLGVDNKIYYQSKEAGIYQDTNLELKDYLFSTKELKAFWKLSHMLAPNYFLLNRLSEIERIPKGKSIEAWGRTQSITSLTCGLAFSEGKILLTDGCLDLEGRYSGDLFEAVTHELSHQMDYHNKSYSSKKEWLDLSGWSEESYTDAKNESKTKWKYTIKYDEFINYYAATAPGEQFAEHLAYYRHDYSGLKKIISTQQDEVIRTKFMSDEFYSNAGLAKIYKKNYRDYFWTAMLEDVSTCADDKCISLKNKKYWQYIQTEIKQNEPEGCSFVKDASETLKLKTELEELFIADLEQLLSFKNDPEKLENWRGLINNDEEFVKIMVQCLNDKEDVEKQCYNTKVEERVDDSEIVKRFKKLYPYEALRQEVNTRLSNMIDLDIPRARTHAEESVLECVQVKINYNEAYLTSSFKLGTSYAPTSIYNCLAKKYELILPSIKDVDENSLKDLTSQIRAHWTTRVKELLQVKSDEDKKRLNESETQFLNITIPDLKTRTDWIKNSIKSDCLDIWALRIKDLIFIHAGEKQPSSINSACTSLATNQDLSVKIEEDKMSKQTQKIISYKADLALHIKNQANLCVYNYPIDTTMKYLEFKTQREDCLTQNVKAMINSFVKKLEMPSEIKLSLEEDLNKLALPIQGKILREKFKNLN
jgi:hypothetical protein